MEPFRHPILTVVSYLVFAASITLEAHIYRRRRGKPYPWAESGASLVVMLLHLLSGIIVQLVIVGVFAAIVWHWRIYTMPLDRWWAWVLLFFLAELAYYWYHRTAHRVAFLWANHRVHHSSNELTLASAYRIAPAPVLALAWLFFMPIVWIGFPAVTVFVMLTVNLAYQFWLHTTLIPKLGPIEGILNTPSAHRVHHARNVEYLDKNYGGILMIFDCIFGSYQPEEPAIAIDYGLVDREPSVNPLWVAYGGYLSLLGQVRAASWRERWKLLRKPPGWSPAPAGAGDGS
jgi:sterol desaturase/sphingolipid hydroxylase (fatty acid hydroxylase superfamily)